MSKGVWGLIGLVAVAAAAAGAAYLYLRGFHFGFVVGNGGADPVEPEAGEPKADELEAGEPKADELGGEGGAAGEGGAGE